MIYIQYHILHTWYQHVEKDNEQGIICHPDNYINFNNTNQGTNNSYLYYKKTNSLLLSISNHVESLHTYINPLILNTTQHNTMSQCTTIHNIAILHKIAINMMQNNKSSKVIILHNNNNSKHL